MSADRPTDGPLPLSLVRQIDDVCTKFENAWKAGQQPSIADYVSDVEVPANELLRELLFIDVAYRVRSGEIPVAATYASIPNAAMFVDEVLRTAPSAHAEDTSDLQAGETAQAAEVKRDPDDTCPQRVGRYRTVELLGEGAFGTVYLARDEQLNRSVAIKVLHADWMQSVTARSAFDREAKLAANLKHPCIVTVHDVGHTEDGEPYFVMEHIEGQRLDDKLRSGPLGPLRSAEILVQIAEAVAYAHGEGLVHRDIKPANILLDREGVPHVSDFGLALPQDKSRLQGGEISGTAAYMSPEQIRGDTSQIDSRADVWGLGVVLYEMLTGRRPFKSKTRDALFDEILHQDPTPLRQLRDDIPAELESICLHCLEKDPAQRLSSADALVVQLRSIFPDLPDTTTQPATFGQVSRSARGLGVAAIAVMGCLIVGGVLWSRRGLVRPSATTDPATTRPTGDHTEAQSTVPPASSRLGQSDSGAMPAPTVVSLEANSSETLLSANATQTRTPGVATVAVDNARVNTETPESGNRQLDVLFTLSSGNQFATLAEAVVAARDGDIITVAGSTTSLTEPIDTFGKSLTIRAEIGSRPIISLADHGGDELIYTTSRLVIEGIGFRRRSDWGIPAVIRADRPATVHALNCRFVQDTPMRGACIAIRGVAECSLTNCEFYSTRANAVHWFPIANGTVRMRNCVHLGAVTVVIGPLSGFEFDATVESVNCSAFATTANRVTIPRRLSRGLPASRTVRFNSSSCFFHVDSPP